MGMDWLSWLPAAVVAQAEPAGSAPAWVEYAVYGGIALVLAVIILRTWRKGPPPPPVERVAPHEPEKTPEEIEAEARRAFGITEALVREESDHIALRVRAPVPEKKAPPKPEGKPASAPPKPAEQKPSAPAKPAAPPVEEAGKTLREGLARTKEGFVRKLGRLFGAAKTIDDDLLGELEEALFTADIGVKASQKLVDKVHEGLDKKELQQPAKVWTYLKAQIGDMLRIDAPPFDLARANPLVIMVVGVNGAGKTTTIGKLAKQFTDQGKKVVLAAGDTFRAAAVEQLDTWAQRCGADIVRGAEGSDPSSVIFDGVANFEQFNGAFVSLHGRDEELPPEEMRAFADFIMQLTYPPNPIRNLDNSLTDLQAAGRARFYDDVHPGDARGACARCHDIDLDANADSALPGRFGTSGELTFTGGTQWFKVAQLRGLYEKVGKFGMADTWFVNVNNALL
ncbi:MAG: signal recognition particle receptor subunit alpha, partial [Myxococcales bacterium]|nr:signal recognition particle receptor subunit alpha [Myxococcales bacterium]